jgi:hypothetical protein
MPTLLATEPFVAIRAEGGGAAFCFLFWRRRYNHFAASSARLR